MSDRHVVIVGRNDNGQREVHLHIRASGFRWRELGDGKHIGTIKHNGDGNPVSAYHGSYQGRGAHVARPTTHGSVESAAKAIYKSHLVRTDKSGDPKTVEVRDMKEEFSSISEGKHSFSTIHSIVKNEYDTIARNPKMYTNNQVRAAYHHPKLDPKLKKRLGDHLDFHHGSTDWRNKPLVAESRWMPHEGMKGNSTWKYGHDGSYHGVEVVHKKHEKDVDDWLDSEGFGPDKKVKHGDHIHYHFSNSMAHDYASDANPTGREHEKHEVTNESVETINSRMGAANTPKHGANQVIRQQRLQQRQLRRRTSLPGTQALRRTLGGISGGNTHNLNPLQRALQNARRRIKQAASGGVAVTTQKMRAQQRNLGLRESKARDEQMATVDNNQWHNRPHMKKMQDHLSKVYQHLSTGGPEYKHHLAQYEAGVQHNLKTHPEGENAPCHHIDPDLASAYSDIHKSDYGVRPADWSYKEVKAAMARRAPHKLDSKNRGWQSEGVAAQGFLGFIAESKYVPDPDGRVGERVIRSKKGNTIGTVERHPHRRGANAYSAHYFRRNSAPESEGGFVSAADAETHIRARHAEHTREVKRSLEAHQKLADDLYEGRVAGDSEHPLAAAKKHLIPKGYTHQQRNDGVHEFTKGGKVYALHTTPDETEWSIYHKGNFVDYGYSFNDPKQRGGGHKHPALNEEDSHE